ncbi:type II toxin-antitoxin system VapC family toxin [Candidatus Peregrinibacteria bacterium]|nr:MAG: type II toxin-antitoxin system VapC family toxin [Candidatus Peregrinibacteria bacterium]
MILDTSFIFAYFNSVDSLHKKARHIFKSSAEEPHFVSFLVYQELLTLMTSRFSSKEAIQLSEILLSEDSGIQLLKMDEEYFEESVALFEELSPHKLSFVDISLLVLAKNLEAKVLTFDERLVRALNA